MRWSTGGRFLVIADEKQLLEEVGSKLFKQRSIGSLYRQLNIYGFRVGFEFFNIGYASALMLTLTAIVFGAVLALNRLRHAVAW